MVKDEAYYSERLEEVRARSKGLSIVARGENEDEGKIPNMVFMLG